MARSIIWPSDSVVLIVANAHHIEPKKGDLLAQNAFAAKFYRMKLFDRNSTYIHLKMTYLFNSY